VITINTNRIVIPNDFYFQGFLPNETEVVTDFTPSSLRPTFKVGIDILNNYLIKHCNIFEAVSSDAATGIYGLLLFGSMKPIFGYIGLSQRTNFTIK
jgi:hypothetical protein